MEEVRDQAYQALSGSDETPFGPQAEEDQRSFAGGVTRGKIQDRGEMVQPILQIGGGGKNPFQVLSEADGVSRADAIEILLIQGVILESTAKHPAEHFQRRVDQAAEKKLTGCLLDQEVREFVRDYRYFLVTGPRRPFL